MGQIDKLVKNFINQHKGPFNCAMVCSLCNLNHTQVRPVLARLYGDGTIAKHERGLYLRNRHTIIIDSIDGKWNYSTEAAKMILDAIDSKPISSARKLAEAIGYSRQYAFKYLESLATAGCIGFSIEGRYVVIHRDLSRLGETEKGIISKLKAKVGYR